MVGLMGFRFCIGWKMFSKQLNTFYICCNLYLIELSQTDIANINIINWYVSTLHIYLAIQDMFSNYTKCVAFTSNIKVMVASLSVFIFKCLLRRITLLSRKALFTPGK